VRITRWRLAQKPSVTPCGSLAGVLRRSLLGSQAHDRRANSLIPLNKGRSSLDPVADHSRDQRNRGRVSHNALPKAALDNTPAAIRSPKDRIATGDHTPGALAKPHTELRAVAVVADHIQMADRNRLARYSGATGRRRAADRRPVAGRTRHTSDSRAAGHTCKAGRRRKADRRVVLHPRLRRDREKLQWRVALSWWQSQ
jgi:hypothetical protein